MTDIAPRKFTLKSGRLPNGGEDKRVKLFLYQMENSGKPPVLLLHGASAQHESFLFPRRDLAGNARSLAEYLWGQDFEPWLLDWRGSCEVVDAAKDNGKTSREPSFEDLQEVFDFDHAAEYDIPTALEFIAKSRGEKRDGLSIGVVGHCMGGGILAQALASESLKPDQDDYRVTRVVLLALGLFYEPALEGELKAQAHVLADLQRGSEPVLEVDPRKCLDEWPESLREFYRNLGREPHAGRASPADEICNRLTFMYGAPYAERRLVPETHRDVCKLRFRCGAYRPEPGDPLRAESSDAEATLLELEMKTGTWRQEDAEGTMTLVPGRGAFVERDILFEGTNRVGEVVAAKHYRAELPEQFGAIPLRMFAHGAQNVRRGWAGRYDTPDNDLELKGRSKAERMLNGLDSLTLISGSKNQLWRPQSICQMHEWLVSSGVRDAREKCRRHIMRGFAHQDLLWGKDAPEKVFPLITEGLRGL
jgi:pimeloyl-ACP methyl ester carboxylesterase